MTPNLFLATQTLFSPHKWFKTTKHTRPVRTTEHWSSPVPGLYEYIPGRGWYLIATDKSPADSKAPDGTLDTVKMTQPVQVKYSKVLKKHLLAPDYEMRKRHGRVKDANGKSEEAGFFRLDDGIAWVKCWDENGEFIPGPYKLWTIDKTTGVFRHMVKGDDPKGNGEEREEDTQHHHRRSQDSRSTQYFSDRGSQRDPGSVPSTRANSIHGLTVSASSSNPGSRAPSRPSSQKGKDSPKIPLSEATTLLNPVAAEHAAARASAVGDYERLCPRDANRA
ncbi:uncharacterized protein BDR25DRAFT_336659 [Lindgomyces ingoldianus]|uniref:Uncharacterized protein n=1 Tax=Lindgomyces ingoldianus TaxID=673940 RepID=A0ACB6QIF0_9PLEO|nr:uncharacterized protein BDR25DRAFT_336659 [Lindgomyces ingoldianus]KAF2466107.1 hypothetical protein BDR25DRAFT_336659 [Lindgomyces ingoldianus]